MGFETARKPASSPPRRPAGPPSAAWRLSTEIGRSRWGWWKRRIGRGTGKPAGLGLSLSFISVPLSPLLLVLYSVAATDGCGGGVAAPAAFVLLPLSLGSRAAHSLTSRSLPSVLEEEEETEGRRRRR